MSDCGNIPEIPKSDCNADISIQGILSIRIFPKNKNALNKLIKHMEAKNFEAINKMIADKTLTIKDYKGDIIDGVMFS